MACERRICGVRPGGSRLIGAKEFESSDIGKPLSTREHQIVALGAQGATDKEIACHLGLSIPTLRTYWMRIRNKVGATSRTHAIALVRTEAPVARDPRSLMIENLTRDKVATWVWNARRREVLLDEAARNQFSLAENDETIPLDRLLAHIWAPDRARFERFLRQAADLRPMTPIELRTGVPGHYSNQLRAVNLACGSLSDPSLVLASTTIHRFHT